MRIIYGVVATQWYDVAWHLSRWQNCEKRRYVITHWLRLMKEKDRKGRINCLYIYIYTYICIYIYKYECAWNALNMKSCVSNAYHSHQTVNDMPRWENDMLHRNLNANGMNIAYRIALASQFCTNYMWWAPSTIPQNIRSFGSVNISRCAPTWKANIWRRKTTVEGMILRCRTTN